MAAINWVCSSCAKHFSRRYTANRHDRNLHEGKGNIVSILDYVVGRMSGQFQSKNPLESRRDKQNGLLFGSKTANNNFGPKVIADSMNGASGCQNVIPRQPTNTNSTHDSDKKGSPYPHLWDFSLLPTKPDKTADEPRLDIYKQATAKLAEIEQLLRPFTPPDFVRNVITQLTEICNATGNYDILDEA